jgi:hypothetical protein
LGGAAQLLSFDNMALEKLSTLKMNRVYILLWLCLSTAVRAATITVTIATDMASAVAVAVPSLTHLQ